MVFLQKVDHQIFIIISLFLEILDKSFITAGNKLERKCSNYVFLENKSCFNLQPTGIQPYLVPGSLVKLLEIAFFEVVVFCTVAA